jgi:hypothetical protein
MLDGKLVNFFKLFVMKEPDTKLSVTFVYGNLKLGQAAH